MSKDLYHHKVAAGAADGPMLFAFHGTGGDEDQLLPLARQIDPAATIVSPRGDVSEAGAARFFRRTAEGVYDMADLAQRTAAMARFVAAHAAEAPGRRIAGIGYSNGANILASMLFAHPMLFDAAVLMHPLIPFQPTVAGSLSGASVLITAGRRDPICPPELTIRLEAFLRSEGAAVTLAWHDGGHEIRPTELEEATRFLAPIGQRTRSGGAGQ